MPKLNNYLCTITKYNTSHPEMLYTEKVASRRFLEDKVLKNFRNFTRKQLRFQFSGKRFHHFSMKSLI